MASRRRAGWVWVGALALLLAGCGDKVDAGASETPATSVAIFGPAAQTALTPFPSDRYALPDQQTSTGLRVNVTKDNTIDTLVNGDYDVTVEELDEMDGFSTTGGVMMNFTAPIDVRGLVQMPRADPPVLDPVRAPQEYTTSDTPLALVDVDPASPGRGTVIGLSPTWWEQSADGYYPEDYTLLAQPSTPLRPGTRYLFAATKRLLARDGTPVGRSPDMAAMIDGGDQSAYAAEVRDGLAVLDQSLGITPAEVVLATAFTTATVHDALLAAAARERATEAPAPSSAWTIERRGGEGDPEIRFRSTFPAPEFRKPKPDAKWELDETGAPVVQHMEDLEVFLAFSDATRSGPRPVVIFAHGLGDTKDGSWGTAGRLAGLSDNGAAVFAIDSPEHGSRGAGTLDPIDSVMAFFGIDQATQEFDIGHARDNFRQMACDQLRLVRMIDQLGQLDLLPLDADGNPAPDGVPDLDVSRILYIGHSFGSVQGATIFALAPEVRAATWNVGGAGLMMLLRDSGTFNLVVKGLTPAWTPQGVVGRFLAITQGIVDPGDPLNYARHATLEPLPGVEGWESRDVLLQEVVGDTIVPNSTSWALARAAGLEQMDPIDPVPGLDIVHAPVSSNLPAGGTAVMTQFREIDGKVIDHGSLIFTDQAIGQYLEFFRTGITQEHATVQAAQ